MNLEEKRQLAKDKNIKNWHNMKEKNLDKALAEHGAKKKTIPLKISSEAKKLLDDRGFNWERFYIHAEQLRAERLEYESKFKNFKVIRNNKHVDNIIALSF